MLKIEFRKQMLLFVCLMGAIMSSGQVKPLKFKSFTYSPNIIIGDDYKPFFQKVETDILFYNKVDIKFTQGFFGTSYGSYHENAMFNTFFSQSGITQSVDLNVTPIDLERFRVNIGCGLAYMHLKQFKTIRQQGVDVGTGGETLILPFQYFDVDKQSKLGIDFYLDLEYVISNHFAFAVAVNAMNFKGTLNKDYGYFHTGLNIVYYINSQIQQ